MESYGVFCGTIIFSDKPTKKGGRKVRDGKTVYRSKNLMIYQNWTSQLTQKMLLTKFHSFTQLTTNTPNKHGKKLPQHNKSQIQNILIDEKLTRLL